MEDRFPNGGRDEWGRPPDVPDFDLIRPIGRGGFGEVYLATNRTTGHLRAVKVIPLSRRGTTDPVGREITSLTRLEANLRRHHPNLLGIHHVGKTADHLFYVMDPADDVSGNPASSEPSYRPATLQRRLEDGPLEPDECFRRAEELLTGLASLHAAGMVHRDVKPANCLFVGGVLKLADFGLLTEVRAEVSRVGTHKYMPPDGRMDTRADVYAAGLVIYEMITGLPADRFPCLGETAHELAGNPVLNLLIRLVLQACQRDPQRRFRNGQEMLAELKGAQPDVVSRRARFRRRMVASVAGVAIVLGLAMVGWRVWRPQPMADRPQEVQVNFVTEKPFFDAEIYLDGARQVQPDGTAYTTPCTIKDLPATVHHVVFRREGVPELDVGPVDFAQTRQIRGHWDAGLQQ